MNHELLHHPDLYQGWELFDEHGEHNFYINKKTEQHLEACDFPITKLEQLDAFFLNIFVDTSTQYSELKKVIQPSYHEWDRILDYIKDNYVLTDEHQILPSSL